jgi:hypothetical protein
MPAGEKDAANTYANKNHNAATATTKNQTLAGASATAQAA